MLSGFHSLAALTFERLLYSITAGTALVIIVSVALRLLPARNSHTRFAIWFSALLAVAASPFAAFISVPWQLPKSTAPVHRLLTVPASWAEYIVLAWAFVAVLGMVRVMLGLWQLRQLRRYALPLDICAMAPEIRDVIADRIGLRPVQFLVSERVEVPTAIGFIRPAIILPAWLVADSSGNSRNQDLKYVLLHELAHLRRWDDWTNLAQKVVKSILFFHPGVLWVERKLALDREMACDDAVLSETGSPQNYAQCLAGLAEKSFLRRQIALAQAAVSRMRQLSLRVAWILDRQSLHNTRIWKPAVPMVAAAAVLCAISASTTTELVGFSDGKSLSAAVHTMPMKGVERAPASNAVNSSTDSVAPAFVHAGVNRSPDVRAVPANLKYNTGQQQWKAQRPKVAVPQRRTFIQRAGSDSPQHRAGDQARLILSSYSLVPPASEGSVDNKNQAQQHGQVVLLVVTSRSFSSDRNPGWQVSAWEFYLYVPKQIPRKT